MKRSISIVFALVLAFCFAFASFGSVHAFPSGGTTNVTWGDPTAVPSVKGAGITSEVLGQPELPGTAMLGSGEFVPVGFPLDKQNICTIIMPANCWIRTVASLKGLY